MRLVGLLLVLGVLAGLTACNSNESAGASDTAPSFRSLGKRADSSLNDPPVASKQ